jgi:hypothetical protein
MATVNDNYPKSNGTSEISDEQLKELALQNFKQDEVKKHKFPTEFIELPSKGLLYPADSLLASGKIEMKYMTAREEDILTSQNLIKQGVVLDKLFQSLIVSPINYNELLTGDKNAIMIAARVLGYGKDYEVEITDPFSDGSKQKVVIDLTTIEPKEYDFDSITPHKSEFEIILPISKRVVTFQLLNYGLDQKIKAELRGMAKVIKNTGVDKELTTRLKNVITSVDGTRDRVFINNFVDNELFAGDSKFLRNELKSKTPDLDMTFVFTSDVTGETQVMEVPMDVSFFWPKS